MDIEPFTYGLAYLKLYRNLRQLPQIDRRIEVIAKKMGIKANNIDLKSDRMKFLEGCIEAPLQICLQLYIIAAGNLPGN